MYRRTNYNLKLSEKVANILKIWTSLFLNVKCLNAFPNNSLIGTLQFLFLKKKKKIPCASNLLHFQQMPSRWKWKFLCKKLKKSHVSHTSYGTKGAWSFGKRWGWGRGIIVIGIKINYTKISIVITRIEELTISK